MCISGEYARRRFDQRKAVMPFRMGKWQSPAQPSRTDFARSRCSLIRGSHVRHRVYDPFERRSGIYHEKPFVSASLFDHALFTIELKLKGRLYHLIAFDIWREILSGNLAGLSADKFIVLCGSPSFIFSIHVQTMQISTLRVKRFFYKHCEILFIAVY